MNLVDAFLEQYRRSFDLYERAARLGQLQCDIGLCSVRTQIRSRAKSFDSLRQKLLCRAETKGYTTLEQIAEDIPDLAGVRIALYFPGDLLKVERFLLSHFDVEPDGVRRFPLAMADEGSGAVSGRDAHQRRFSGYSALHFRARSRVTNLAREDAAFAGVRLEIQVASVLMHAWAEVEHDLVYKPGARPLSDGEHGILDEVNGLVLVSEMALERLQRSLDEKPAWSDPLSNHYELAAYLRATVEGLAEAEDRGDIMIGPADVLFQLLCRCDLLSQARLEACLADFRLGDPSAPHRAAERVIIHLLAADPMRAAEYVRARDYINRPRGVLLSSDQQAEVARFLNRWFVLARGAEGAGEPAAIAAARRICDAIIRCIDVPSADQLAATTRSLEEMLRAHWAAAPGPVRDFMARALVHPALAIA